MEAFISPKRGVAILGLSEFSTPFSIWQEIQEERNPGFNKSKGFKLPSKRVTASTTLSNVLKNAISDVVKTDKEYIVPGGFYYFLLEGHIPVSSCIDGLYKYDYDNEHLQPYLNGHFLHKSTVTSTYNFNDFWGEPETDKIPQDKQIEIQHELLCSGATECILSVLVLPERLNDLIKKGLTIVENKNGTRLTFKAVNKKYNFSITAEEIVRTLMTMGMFHQYRIKENQKVHDMLKVIYKNWWSEFIIKKKEPYTIEYRDILRLCPNPYGTIICPEEIERLILENKEIGKELGENGRLQKRREKIKTEVLTWSRKQLPEIDNESVKKTLFLNQQGRKIGQYDGITFR